MTEYRTHDQNYTWTGNWTVLVENTESTETRYTHSDLSSKIRYCYRISAINEHGVGLSSDVRCASPFQYEMVPTTKNPTSGFGIIVVLISIVLILYFTRKK